MEATHKLGGLVLRREAVWLCQVQSRMSSLGVNPVVPEEVSFGAGSLCL